MNVNGWSSLSDPIFIRAAVAPGKPPKPTLVSATDSEMTLQFYKPVDNGGSEITGFKLFRNDGDSSVDPHIEVTTYASNLLRHTLTVTDDSLETGLLYRFKFEATNLVGNSQESDISEFALVTIISAPGKPSVLLDHTSEAAVAVQWSQVGAYSPPGYQVFGYVLEMKDTRDAYGTY
jgi:hypothetical protein